MLRSVLSRMTYANVVASLALFVALGGAGFAASQLPKNSVGTSQIKNNAVVAAKIKSSAVESAKLKNDAVVAAKIKNGAIETAKLANDAVTGAQVKAGSLDASDITGAVAAANVANGLAKVTYKTATATVPAYSGSGSAPGASATATCDAGQSVLGGGIDVESDADEIVNDSHPAGTNGWTGVVYNYGAAAHGLTVTAICTAVSATG